jgi:Xaa-Pro aminopeptidase
MAERGATHHLVATLDDIAWLTNLRGQDTWPIPLFTAFLLIGRERATLFTAPQRLTLALKAALSQDGIEVAPYDEALRTLAALPTEACLWVDGTRVGGAALAALPASVTVVDQPNPSTLHKACKSPAELDHLREALAEDCAAMAEVYAWFDGACTSGTVTELDVMHRLAEARARRPNFVSVANDPVVGFNANSLQYHRSPSPGDNARIRGEGVLLVDSGGQYLGGTTDVTRVLPVGPASDALRRDHTRVLKAVIALTELRFPRGTLSPMIDAIARAPLWAAGIDFLHATGHGVGYHLCVHEGPQSIARRQPHPSMAFEPGMVCTVEPSVERAGSYHLHIENMIAAVRWDDPEGGRYGEFLRFETLSMLPIDTRLVDPRLLRPDELVWLDRYHAEVRTRLRPLVDEPTWRWLDERTRPLAG